MEVSVRYLGEAKFEVAGRGHRVICDQPIDNGGADEGMSPPEFLLASLATCAGYYAAQYLKTRGLSAEDRRQVLIQLTRRGETILEKLGCLHRQQLKQIGPEICQLLERLGRTEE